MKATQTKCIDAGEYFSELKDLYHMINHQEVSSVKELLKKETLLIDIESAIPGGMVIAWRREEEEKQGVQLDELIQRRASLLSDYWANGGTGDI